MEETGFFKSSWAMSITALAAYFGFSVFLTWPLLLDPTAVVFGGPGDAAGAIWGIWSNFITTSETIRLGAPFGFVLPRTFSQPVADCLMVAMGNVFGPIPGYNLLVLASFPLTAFATFLCLRSLIKSDFSAFFGGLIFGFAPAALAHGAGGHLSFSLNMFVPVFLLSLFYNHGRRTLFSAALVGGAFTLVTLTSLYMGFFCAFAWLTFASYDWATNGAAKQPAVLMNYAAAFCFALLFILPFEYKALIEMFSGDKTQLAQTGRVRTLGALVVYSVRMWEYFLPSIDHPVLGKIFEGFIGTHLHGSNTTEQTLYLGLAPLGLFFTGLVLFFRNKFSPERRFYFLFFAIAAAFMVVMSFPPYIPLGPVKIPLIGYFTHKIAPMFRVYSRFGILVNLFVACGAAVTLAHLAGVMSKGRFYALAGVLTALLLFEYRGIPHNYGMPVKPPPPVYQWLAAEPGDFIVAEYPMMPNDEAGFYTYMLWQTFHGKRLVNGTSPILKESWEFFQKVNYPSDFKTLEVLRKAGVKYLIVHPELYASIPPELTKHFSKDRAEKTYNNNVPPPVLKKLKPYKVFGQVSVYKL